MAELPCFPFDVALEGREKTARTAERSDRILVDVNGALEENRDARDKLRLSIVVSQ
jgi:hypothetical protein